MILRRLALVTGAALLVGLGFALRQHPEPFPLPAVEPLAAAAAPAIATPPPPGPNGDHDHDHDLLHNGSSLTVPPPREVLAAWSQAPGEPRFAAFHAWVQRRNAAAAPAALENEGVALARARLAAMTDLIRRDPQQALAWSVPAFVRAQLPASVQAHLETPVNTRGDYEVLCVLPVAGTTPAGDALVRRARIGDQTYRVYTYDRGLDYVTRSAVPINGIAVPISAAELQAVPSHEAASHWMALDPNPARRLDAGELAAYQNQLPMEPVCTATGESLQNAPAVAALQLAGQILPFRSPAVAALWAETNLSTASLNEPQNPANLPTAASSYTEGRKRFILFRVDFPDYAGEVMTTNQALSLMSGMSNFMAEISFGKLVTAPVGQGSDITPTMRLPNAVETYQNMGTLLGACRTAATALGYDMNQYDFYFVCTAGKPTASFAGLGYVGGVGFWLANRYFDVRTGAHEFGHNLGLGHANWWNTGGGSMLGTGTSDEYGDVFDTMGINGGGNMHFSSYSKNKLGWIPNEDCPTVTTSGFYRLYAHDDVRGNGLRGLRLKRASGDYWVEFRQKFTGNRALMNGLGFRWVGGSTTLLDANPGSAGNKDDHPVVIGRTFSDRKLGIHVTPTGKGNTYPESLDVVVNLGSFAANRPPAAQVNASAVNVAVNTPVTFSASASDPDGDALAYYWDFGNGSYSTDNQPAATLSFTSAGEYFVQCTVSDLKGGLGVGGVVVRVGAPATYRLAGRVLTTNSAPVAGVWVRTDASHYAVTRDDGSFEITRLGAGTHTLQVFEPFYGEKNFVSPFFENPIVLTASFREADFVEYPGALTITTPLVARESAWRYLDNGSNQGTAWRAAGFDDSGWASGSGIFGYGQGNERTTLSFGGVSTNKHLTYYFRRTFTNHPALTFTNLALEVLRDDGVIVYLNGSEVFRDNMPAGAADYLTRAVAAVEPDNYLRAVLDPAVLLPGVNELAVELHQVEATSSDVNFDLSLSGLTVTNIGGLNLVYIAEPRDGASLATPGTHPLSVTVRTGGAAVTQVRMAANGETLFTRTTPPYNGLWTNPPAGAYELTAEVWLDSGLVLTSAPVRVQAQPPAPAQPPPTQLALINTGARWSFFSGPTGAPPAWAQFDYVEPAGWSNGPAELGYGENDEATRVSYGASSANKWITAYFRRPFVVNDPYSITSAVAQLKRDDGAVVYLNGVELFRDLLPDGPVLPTTLASQAADDGKNFNAFNFGRLPLRPGTNVLAVEVHQSAVDSSDLSFDLSLTALLATNRSRGVWLTAPAAGAQLPAGGGLALACEPVAGNGLGVTRVAYYANGLLIGQAAYPYDFVWAHPTVGSVEILARATDTQGGTFLSAPVSVTITAPPPGRSLVAFGEVWKYLDDGSNAGTAWKEPAFDDFAWRSGAARLGYGGDGERTQISDGGDPNYRPLTAYFRKTFTVASTAFDDLTLRLVCDDGAVVYLNGREVHRQNLAPGLVSHNSLALTAVGGAAETTPVAVALSPNQLVAGLNTLAVEVHQNSLTSSDSGFDLELTGQTPAPVTAEGAFYLTSPSQGQLAYTPASLALTAYAVTNGQAATRVEYFANGAALGQSAAYPYAFTWADAPAGIQVLHAVAEFPGGVQATSAPVAISVTAPPPPIQPVMETWVAASSLWRFWDNVATVGAGWQQPAFDDSAWPVGQARFGWGFDGEKTELTAGRITHYFRQWFTVTNPVIFTELVVQLARDDGAVVYLNGRELLRSNLPAGAITEATLAATTVNTPDETTFYETRMLLSSAGLLTGSNLLAIELHQSSATSSDGGFDLQLIGRGTTEPRIALLQPANGQIIGIGQTINLEAQAWTGADVTGLIIEFYDGDIKLGETAPGGTRFDWSNAAFGEHRLTARARDAGNRSLVSAVSTITVAHPPYSAALIAAGAAWKYWDAGSLPSVNWARRSYNDQSWSNGVARLGFGADGERTPIRTGPSNNKYTAYYFRRWFEVPANVTLTNLTFNLLRDDGAVVYLNGAEVYRSNMPATAISYATLASSAISDTAEQTFYPTVIPVAGLTAGSNLVAVEIHQSSVTSSDLGFDLSLSAAGYQGVPARALVSPPLPAGEQYAIVWPVNMYGWNLYRASRLEASPIWLPVTSGITQTNGFNVYRFAPTESSLFYRLEQR